MNSSTGSEDSEEELPRVHIRCRQVEKVESNTSLGDTHVHPVVIEDFGRDLVISSWISSL